MAFGDEKRGCGTVNHFEFTIFLAIFLSALSSALFVKSSWSNWLSFIGQVRSSWQIALPRAHLSWQFTLKPNWAGRQGCPRAKPLAFQNTISQVENPILVVSLDSTLETADSLVCNSLFVWNPSPDSMLGNATGSCGSPFYLELVHTPYSLAFSHLSLPQSKVWWELVVHTGPSLG